MDGRVAFDDEVLSPTDERDDANIGDPDRVVALLPTGGTTAFQSRAALQPYVVSSAIGSVLAIDIGPATAS